MIGKIFKNIIERFKGNVKPINNFENNYPWEKEQLKQEKQELRDRIEISNEENKRIEYVIENGCICGFLPEEICSYHKINRVEKVGYIILISDDRFVSFRTKGEVVHWLKK